jgi:hypothetical protein
MCAFGNLEIDTWLSPRDECGEEKLSENSILVTSPRREWMLRIRDSLGVEKGMNTLALGSPIYPPLPGISVSAPAKKQRNAPLPR